MYLAGARRWRQLSLYGLGALIGGAPILYYLLRAPRVFLFQNVTYHYLINIFRGVGFHVPLWPLALVAALVLIAAPFLWAEAWAIVILLAAAMIGLVTPAILFPQYWAPPDFLLVLLGCLIFARRVAAKPRLAAPIVGAALLIAAVRAAQMIAEAHAQYVSSTYGVIAVGDFRARLAATMAPIEAGCHGDLITAFATPAVGTGIRVAPISSEGPFMMRMDQVFVVNAPAFRQYSDVTRYLTPSSVILTGAYPGTPYETVMVNYALSHKFRAVDEGRFMWAKATLYLPAGCR